MSKPAHAHYYYSLSTENEDHRHVVDGFTFNVNGNGEDNHIHQYTGITSFENNHYHRYYGKTGPPIKLPDGTHYHEISGRTYFNYNDPLPIEYGGIVYGSAQKEVHDHNYKGRTDSPIGYFPPGW